MAIYASDGASVGFLLAGHLGRTLTWGLRMSGATSSSPVSLGWGAMSGEMVFTVSGASATVAQPISLADAGLQERGHLQEWVLTHPEMLGPDVKVVAFEFGRWTATSGALARDRLDVLGLDRDGRLVVVELKRDQAPDTVDMQALKYASLVSRFTRDDLAKVHAQYLTRGGASSWQRSRPSPSWRSGRRSPRSRCGCHG